MQAESLIPSDAPPRLYQKIANLLREKITQGEWQAGDTLPSERDLAKWLNVSRTSVREAIIALEVSGWLEVKVGKGFMFANKRKIKILI